MTGIQARGAALVAALMLLAGCGGGDGDDQDGGGGTSASTPAPTETPAAEGTATPEATATETPAPAEGASIAEGQGSADGARFVFRITELKRSGPTVVLNATVEWAEGGDGSIQIASTFNDGQYQKLEDDDADESGDVFDGVALIDPEGRKKYLVARESTGRCVCSVDLNSAFVTEETPISLEATLTAPPEDVTTVNVFVPRVKTFTDVPIS
jgi:hypothetical protein